MILNRNILNYIKIQKGIDFCEDNKNMFINLSAYSHLSLSHLTLLT